VTLSGRRRRQHIIAMQTSLKADNLAPPWHKRRNAAVWRGASNTGKMDFFLRFKPDYPCATHLRRLPPPFHPPPPSPDAVSQCAQLRADSGETTLPEEELVDRARHVAWEIISSLLCSV
jgi:hypothetical protein